jgi:hypothetical protein
LATRESQNPFRLSANSVKLVEEYLRLVLEHHKKQEALRDKMESIDVAYARYKVLEQVGDTSGTDPVQVANTTCGITEKDITVPVVIAQVDSFVGYLADVYLSGYPIFPVVSDPKDKVEAEMLEAIIDTHSVMGAYQREFLMTFRDGIKYNFMPLEHVWEPMEHYQLMTDMLKPAEAAQLKASTSHYTKIKRMCPYNTVWDDRVAPSRVCYDGEFAGHIEIVPRIPLKRFINMYSKSGELYNLGKIQDSQSSSPSHFYFNELPVISNYSRPNSRKGDSFDWAKWLGLHPQIERKRTLSSGVYERLTLYCRIIPSEFAITNVPQQNTPQIWKFVLINGEHLLQAKRIYTIYDALPVLIGQPLEDGFELQTQSLGEAQIPFQDAASTLFNIRFNAARRAVSDRALYDPSLINQSDVNTKEPAAKIPVRLSGLNDKVSMDMAYKQIPYDSRGTDSVITDARNVLELSDRQSGLNQPQQGRFQKGNKSVREWEDTMNNADNRPRLPALTIEFHMMIPIKEQIKQNIFQHGAMGTFQSFKSGAVYKVDQKALDSLKQKVLSFRIADGFTPKSKMASTEMLAKGMDTIAQVPQLAASWGAGLPNMFAHMMSLGGVRGLEQYLPEQSIAAGTGGAGGTTTPQT